MSTVALVPDQPVDHTQGAHNHSEFYKELRRRPRAGYLATLAGFVVGGGVFGWLGLLVALNSIDGLYDPDFWSALQLAGVLALVGSVVGIVTALYLARYDRSIRTGVLSVVLFGAEVFVAILLGEYTPLSRVINNVLPVIALIVLSAPLSARWLVVTERV